MRVLNVPLFPPSLVHCLRAVCQTQPFPKTCHARQRFPYGFLRSSLYYLSNTDSDLRWAKASPVTAATTFKDTHSISKFSGATRFLCTNALCSGGKSYAPLVFSSTGRVHATSCPSESDHFTTAPVVAAATTSATSTTTTTTSTTSTSTSSDYFGTKNYAHSYNPSP
jgi:hypothetical protein